MASDQLVDSQCASASLYSRLAHQLPAASEFNFYHVSTPPTKSDPLFAPAPGEKQQRTYCESHFLTASVTPSDHVQGQRLLVYAIEVLLYTTKSLTTLFVSKADSTGYLHLLPSAHSASPSAIRTITSTFISWLAEHRQRPHVPFVVSLFARAQDQYLFPGSVQNAGKHVLDDRQLVKWWCKTLDPVLRHHRLQSPDDDDDHATAQAYVIVPGFDKYETTSFFPPSHRADQPTARKWHYGHPLRTIAPNPTAPPRCLVPHFPDDPKARFLDELDGEIPDLASSQTLFSPSKRGHGMWKSIKTLDQFWDTMAFRQECSSGRLVGFIWLVFTPFEAPYASQTESFDSQRSLSPTPGQPRATSLTSMTGNPPPHVDVTSSSRKPSRVKKLTGPIIPRAPKIKSSSSSISATSKAEDSRHYRWPEEGRGQALMDHGAYLRVHDLLLRLDFATREAATRSSRKWIEEVQVLGTCPADWGSRVVGLVEVTSNTPAAQRTEGQVYVNLASQTLPETDSSRPVQNLTGMMIRKKRKPEAEATSSSYSDSLPATINILDNGTIRKKPKDSSS